MRHPTLLPPRDREPGGRGRTPSSIPVPLPPYPVPHSIKTEHPTTRARRTSLLSSGLYLLVPLATYYRTEELSTSVCVWASPIAKRE